MLQLRHQTPVEWATIALENLEAFLQNHAAAERKVSQSALKLAVQHPSHSELVDALIDVAREELEHFRAVYDLLLENGWSLAQDEPDPYIGALRRATKAKGVDEYLMNRLILFGIIEARGCERFGLIANELPAGRIKDFYADLTRSEARHHALYLQLARRYFDDKRVDHKLDQLLDLEASVVSKLTLRPTVY
jgi:tRNA-(ms[2]io[6]A)-hydroxylase